MDIKETVKMADSVQELYEMAKSATELSINMMKKCNNMLGWIREKMEDVHYDGQRI